MHVCGTHQDTLMKHGLDSILKENGITILQGPGCPVCVTSPKEIEEMITLAQQGKIVTSFGDMMQVPGETHSLQYMRTENCDVRTVYSIEDAVSIAEHNPDKEVVFMAVGFETTAPTTAATILNEPPENFSILCAHRTIPLALKAILDMGEINIDGFIDPGHVSTIIGTKPYEFISHDYHIPQVIAGFEPVDLVIAVWLLIQQKEKHNPHVENEYHRAVNKEGNRKAQQMIQTVFQPSDSKWRGFPVIKDSGLSLRSTYENYDAQKKYEDDLKHIQHKDIKEPAGCRCGDLLRGLISPPQCPLFATKCTPETPVGPCMVSAEGSCHIHFKYGNRYKK